MNIEKFKDSSAGKVLKTDDDYYAFIPNRLPPQINYTKELVNLVSEATLQLGNLNGVGTMLPNPNLLIIPYVRKEAVLSSRIEGIQTSLSELFYFEAQRKEEKNKEANRADVLEVLNYVRAMDYGIKRLKELPLSLSLIKEMHGILMKDVGGKHLTPGEFRRSQNWIGPAGCALNEATFVPPSVSQMNKALTDFEKFLHGRENLSGLIQCALIHYQFEVIHPFSDGNGRIGRLLITLFLCARKYLTYPMLYLSAFFEKYRSEYYKRFLLVSQKGDWEEWLKFFLRGVVVQSKDAVENSRAILNLLKVYRKRILQSKVSGYVLELLDEIFKNPYISIPSAAEALKTSYHTAKASATKLVEAKILFEVTDKLRGKVYCAQELLDLLETEK